MNRLVRVFETYVPGLARRPPDWYEHLEDRVAEALAGDRLETALLALPEDETLIWLVWGGGPDMTNPGPVVAAAIGGQEADAAGTTIERAVDARFVFGATGRTRRPDRRA
jgi:hypothetical protein